MRTVLVGSVFLTMVGLAVGQTLNSTLPVSTGLSSTRPGGISFVTRPTPAASRVLAAQALFTAGGLTGFNTVGPSGVAVGSDSTTFSAATPTASASRPNPVGVAALQARGIKLDPTARQWLATTQTQVGGR